MLGIFKRVEHKHALPNPGQRLAIAVDNLNQSQEQLRLAESEFNVFVSTHGLILNDGGESAVSITVSKQEIVDEFVVLRQRRISAMNRFQECLTLYAQVKQTAQQN